MLFNFVFIYIEINVICIALCVIVLSMVSTDLGNIREVKSFRAMTCTFIAMLIIDCLTQLTFRGVLYVPAPLLATAYVLHMSGFGVMAYFWLQFMELQIGSELSRSKKLRVLFLIPLILLLVLTATSPATGWLFRINEQGVFERGPFFALQMFISYFYFATASVHAMITASRTNSLTKKRQLHRVASYIIIPSIGGILQIVFSNGVPVVAPSIAVCIFFIFVNIQRRQIHHDALTELDNRKSLDDHLEEMVSEVTERKPFYLFMLDIDGFKGINDQYGHLAGDRALKVVADTLRCSEIKGNRFVARYGGDEFVILTSDLESFGDDPDALPSRINEVLREKCAEADLGFELSISAGYSKCTSKLTNVTLLLNEADSRLYENKRHK